MFIFGSIIPLNSNVTIVGASGVQNTLNLTGSVGLYTAVDGIAHVPFLLALYISCGVLALASVIQFIRKKITKKRMVACIIIAAVIAGIFCIPAVADVVNGNHGRELKLPLVTWLLILGLCLFNSTIMRTRLG